MKKLVYLLICLFLLSASFTACSSDYDNPPEQPDSHQNETPTDSIGGFEEEDSTLLEPEFSEEMGNNPRYADNHQRREDNP